VICWFQAFAFKCNVCHYGEAARDLVSSAVQSLVAAEAANASALAAGAGEKDAVMEEEAVEAVVAEVARAKSPGKKGKSPASAKKTAGLTPHTKAARNLVESAVQSLVAQEAATAATTAPKSPAESPAQCKSPKAKCKSPKAAAKTPPASAGATPHTRAARDLVDAAIESLAAEEEAADVEMVAAEEEPASPAPAAASAASAASAAAAAPTSASKKSPAKKSPVAKKRKAVGFASPAPASPAPPAAAQYDSDLDEGGENADQVPSSCAPKSPGRPALKPAEERIGGALHVESS
jgi:hypothetical protein